MAKTETMTEMKTHNGVAIEGKSMDLRPPSRVLSLARMGSYHQSRLSFMRSLLRLAHREQWHYERRRWHMDSRGVGHAVYEMRTPHGTYSLLAFAHDLPADMRSDRVIATAWDATFALLRGEVTDADIARLVRQVPHQEAGRVSPKELCLSRANRSVRLWEHAVEALSCGRQPHANLVEEVGYLMRTTAVYGSAKFGTATRYGVGSHRADDMSQSGGDLMAAPFRIEMLCVWLIRNFSLDWLEYLARVRGGDNAVPLAPSLRRKLGIGNSTGLGMAPFVINHPVLTHRWVYARETALARALARASCDDDFCARWHAYSGKALRSVRRFSSEHALQRQKNELLCADMERLCKYVSDYDWREERACSALYRWGESHLSLEGQEMLASLFIECDDNVEDLCSSMGSHEDSVFFIDGSLSLDFLVSVLKSNFAWVETIDFSDRDALSRFWYVSEAKLEPRVGERFDEDGAECELPLGIGYEISKLIETLSGFGSVGTVGDFLQAHPQHRFCVRRVLMSVIYPYGEVCDNLLSSAMLPIDLLRFKLSFFGATNFDPRSDRWVRITMYGGAPFPEEISTGDFSLFDDWVYGS